MPVCYPSRQISTYSLFSPPHRQITSPPSGSEYPEGESLLDYVSPDLMSSQDRDRK